MRFALHVTKPLINLYIILTFLHDFVVNYPFVVAVLAIKRVFTSQFFCVHGVSHTAVGVGPQMGDLRWSSAEGPKGGDGQLGVLPKTPPGWGWGWEYATLKWRRRLLGQIKAVTVRQLAASTSSILICGSVWGFPSI
jgi:hypothetical protein